MAKTGKQTKILTASLKPLATNFRLLMIFTATLLQVLFSNASLTSPQAPLKREHSSVSAYKHSSKICVTSAGK